MRSQYLTSVDQTAGTDTDWFMPKYIIGKVGPRLDWRLKIEGTTCLFILTVSDLTDLRQCTLSEY